MEGEFTNGNCLGHVHSREDGEPGCSIVAVRHMLTRPLPACTIASVVGTVWGTCWWAGGHVGESRPFIGYFPSTKCSLFTPRDAWLGVPTLLHWSLKYAGGGNALRCWLNYLAGSRSSMQEFWWGGGEGEGGGVQWCLDIQFNWVGPCQHAKIVLGLAKIGGLCAHGFHVGVPYVQYVLPRGRAGLQTSLLVHPCRFQNGSHASQAHPSMACLLDHWIPLACLCYDALLKCAASPFVHIYQSSTAS